MFWNIWFKVISDIFAIFNILITDKKMWFTENKMVKAGQNKNHIPTKDTEAG